MQNCNHYTGAAEATYEWSGLSKVENARAKHAPKKFASLIFISTSLHALLPPLLLYLASNCSIHPGLDGEWLGEALLKCLRN